MFLLDVVNEILPKRHHVLKTKKQIISLLECTKFVWVLIRLKGGNVFEIDPKSSPNMHKSYNGSNNK